MSRSHSWCSSRWLVIAALSVVACSACAGSSGGGSAARSPRSAASASTGPAELPACQEGADCASDPGDYVLSQESVVPGLRLTLPGGWQVVENDGGELHLRPTAQPDDGLFIWRDVVAVKSTGAGHGTTVLRGVGASPAALVHWIRSNPDFQFVDPPHSTTVGRGIHGVVLTVTPSRTARYGDAQCPANPHCADFFTVPSYWGSQFYGIGAPEVAQMLFVNARTAGRAATIVVTLDAVDAHDLTALRSRAGPVLSSLRLPGGMTAA